MLRWLLRTWDDGFRRPCNQAPGPFRELTQREVEVLDELSGLAARREGSTVRDEHTKTTTS